MSLQTDESKPKIGHNRLLQICHYDQITGIFTWRIDRGKCRLGRAFGTLDGCGYLAVKMDHEHFKLHRLAWFYMTGVWPKFWIDHINGERTDNRWLNLRESTRSENQQNRGVNKNNKAGVKGVSRHGNSWRAVISANGRTIRLGTFTSIEEAEIAYKDASNKLHGKFSIFAKAAA